MKKLFTLLFAICSVILPLTADDIPFREQRREVFRVTPVQKGDIVFLGNSITNFGVWPEFFGEDAHIVNRGISGIASEEVANHIDLIAEGQPSKLFIMLGINDFANTVAVVPAIRRIVETFSQESPATEIYIQSVLPCNLAARKAVAAPLNEELRNLADELSLTYIDVYSALADNNNPRGLIAGHTNDNLHLLASGYREWTHILQPYIGLTPVIEAGNNQSVNGLSTISNIRLSQYALLPVDDDDILMLGDYNVMTCEWQELLDNPNVKNRGFGQAWGYTLTIDHLAKVAPVVVKGNPAKIFVQCGIRDLDNTNADVQTLWTKYRAVIDDILRRAPRSTVYVQSVIPSAFAANNNSSVKPFNELMKSYAAGTSRVEFVDLYGTLADDSSGTLADRYVGANTEQSHGINGRAYLAWAALIAPLIEGSTPPTLPSDDEFELSEAIYDALAMARSITGIEAAPGYRDPSAAAALFEAVDLARSSRDIEPLRAAIGAFNSAPVVMPTLSDDTKEVWYTFSTPLRAGTFVEHSAPAGGIFARTYTGADNQQWKFVARPDGTMDIVSRVDGSFISPTANYNTQLSTSPERPATGWMVKHIPDSHLFIITTGSVQLNQTAKGMIYNWGQGNNMTDTGCSFLISQADVTSSIESIDTDFVKDTNLQLFDILGRPVNSPSRPGLYILPDRKIIIR